MNSTMLISLVMIIIFFAIMIGIGIKSKSHAADVNGFVLTSVKFGSVDYKVNTDMKFNIVSDNVIIFDKETTLNAGQGSIKL